MEKRLQLQDRIISQQWGFYILLLLLLLGGSYLSRLLKMGIFGWGLIAFGLWQLSRSFQLQLRLDQEEIILERQIFGLNFKRRQCTFSQLECLDHGCRLLFYQKGQKCLELSFEEEGLRWTEKGYQSLLARPKIGQALWSKIMLHYGFL
ncbi:hypothetical protein PPO43_04120 [Saprospira sp. CCB-QB6]|uniref:hypothetical protein n=1 Tax=Saprospira sp. CCB-QB6 TaxID=3023936 RepID=UPI002349AC5E|nr:hypothetical protein [Saprospira sp. CCB-QB6]WCL82288.1 hypothetical protein PPO43_04120 [Saprospira sp. CCB-QB6]